MSLRTDCGRAETRHSSTPPISHGGTGFRRATAAALALIASPLTALAQSAEGGSDLADIRDPINFVPWLIVGAVILVAILLGFVIAWALRRRKRILETRPAEPPIPPAIWARSQLERIEKSSATLDDKSFTSEVSDVLRSYLERAFRVPAPERTTEEFLQLIGEHPVFAGGLRETLDAFLRRSDLIKFARQSLDASQRDPILAEARAVIDKAEDLKPVETPAPKGAPAA